jgi:predicted transcriptional regulator
MARPELILKTIEKNPGIRYREIMGELGLKNGTLSHHLQKLEEQSVLRVERTPRVARFYPLSVNEAEIPIITRLRQETPRRILRLLLDLDEVNFSEMFLRIKRSPGTTSRYVTELVDDGIVKDRFEKGKRFFSLPDKYTVDKLISKYHPDLMDKTTENYSDVIESL